jgi:hypothetical protein
MSKHYFTVTGLKRVREQFEQRMKRAVLLALDEASREVEDSACNPLTAELPTPAADAVEKWLRGD